MSKKQKYNAKKANLICGADIEVLSHSISDLKSEILLVKSKGNKTSQKLYKSK